MQRSNLVIKITSGILFLAMLCYIGFTLIDKALSGAAGQRTVLAVSQTVNKSCSGDGLMIREELVIPGGGDLCEPVAENGGKVAAGQPVAALYDSAQALETSREIESLLQQKARLETLLAYGQASQNAETAETVIRDGVLRLSAALNAGATEDLDLICDEVRAMAVVTAGETYSKRLSEVDSRLETLQGQAASEVSLLYAPESGLYCEGTDGREDLSPALLETLTCAGLADLMAQEGQATGAAGRLITGLRWYFAMSVPAEYGQLTYAGDSLSLRFPRYLDQEVSVRVERVGAAQNGYCLVILSSDREMAALADLRCGAAELIFSSITGIRVPREAARVDADGQAYVYTLVGIQAQRKDIEIIAETEDYYLVAHNPTDENSLREGNEILVNYSGLYEGKVIE